MQLAVFTLPTVDAVAVVVGGSVPSLTVSSLRADTVSAARVLEAVVD